MLSLRDIVKNYTSGDTTVTALQGVSIDFREHEFVSILGPSGCGKTTLLNILGGLDRYDSGDLIIGGRSTKEFGDADWDTYRNHSVGFVFQSYNLIMHQTVLANVELALTLSGVSREERKRRAIEALTQVGLGDQIHKKPNQMSGGQMQRVAIARALVNDPDIILADEPTGALDTTTSVQIMEILRSVSKNKLIVMVTHNPDLAKEYSSRIIRVLDGRVTEDTNPYTPTAEEEKVTAPEEAAPIDEGSAEIAPTLGKKQENLKKGKRSMSFLTALSLSFNNLLTKKTRTLLVSVAGSIGIIGIALILALSNGVDLYIAAIQEETLTSYPISITAETSDYAAMMAAMVGTSGTDHENRDPNKIYVDDSISNMVGAMTSMDKNNLAGFRAYLEAHYPQVVDDITAVQYSYNMDLHIFNASTAYGQNGVLQVSPSGILSDFSGEYAGLSGITDAISIFSEIMPGKKDVNGKGDIINAAVKEQYNLVDGKWPEAANELVLIVDRHNNIANITLYMLGLMNPDEMTAMMAAMMMGEKYEVKTEDLSFTYQDFYDLDLNLAFNSDFYATAGGKYTVDGTELPLWKDLREEDGFLPETVYDTGMKLKIVGVIAPSPDATATSLQGAIGYTSALTELVLQKVNDSEVVKQQIAHPTHDVFSGLPFKIEDVNTLDNAAKAAKLNKYFDTLNPAEKAAAYTAIRTEISDEQMAEYLAAVGIEIENTKTDPGIDKKREFLINLYAFNSKNGSLAKGTFANHAVSIILHAVMPMEGMTKEESIAMFETMVATQYGAMFELDGIEVKSEGPGAAVYQKYAGLVDTLYDTDAKMAAAFNNMTAMTIRMVYPMVEAYNIQADLTKADAPHLQAYMAAMSTTYADPMKKMQYLITAFCMTNGIYNPADPLVSAYTAYLSGLGTGLDAEFAKAVTKEYTSKLTADEAFKNDAIAAYFDRWRADMVTNNQADFAALYADHMAKSDSTYEENLIALGASAGHDALTAINIYPVDFEAKERLSQLIKDYNATVGEEDEISYTDIVAIMMSSVTTIIDAISYVLIAFVSISLVVSSIMIGIITYISVLERIKEIGILRAIGASKRDISRVFNAETMIIGFAAGTIGILVTLLLCLPINAIIHALSGIQNISAVLPWQGGIALVIISIVLTLIAGLIPSRIASKKDPVVALRTE